MTPENLSDIIKFKQQLYTELMVNVYDGIDTLNASEEVKTQLAAQVYEHLIEACMGRNKPQSQSIYIQMDNMDDNDEYV